MKDVLRQAVPSVELLVAVTLGQADVIKY